MSKSDRIKLTEEQENTIRFAYECLYSDCLKEKRKRDKKYKSFIIPRYIHHLKTMQGIINDVLDMDVEFEPLE